MDTEEQLSEASFILGFIGEIETFNRMASEYLTLLNTIISIAKNEYGLELNTKENWNRIRDLRQNEITTLITYIQGIRTFAYRISFKYDVLKQEKYKEFDNIQTELNNLLKREETINENDLIEFVKKINRAYYLISKEVRELKEKARKI